MIVEHYFAQLLFNSKSLFFANISNFKWTNRIFSKQHWFTIGRKSFFYYIYRLNLPAESTMPLSENDKKKANQLLNLPYIQHHQLWLNEVNILLFNRDFKKCYTENFFSLCAEWKNFRKKSQNQLIVLEI